MAKKGKKGGAKKKTEKEKGTGTAIVAARQEARERAAAISLIARQPPPEPELPVAVQVALGSIRDAVEVAEALGWLIDVAEARHWAAEAAYAVERDAIVGETVHELLDGAAERWEVADAAYRAERDAIVAATVGELMSGAAGRWQAAVEARARDEAIAADVAGVMQGLVRGVAERAVVDDAANAMYEMLVNEIAEAEAWELAMTEPLTAEDRQTAALMVMLNGSDDRMAEAEAVAAAVAAELAVAAAAAEQKRADDAVRQKQRASERRKKDAAAIRAAEIERKRAEEEAAVRATTARIEESKRAKARELEATAKARQKAADAAHAAEMSAKTDGLTNSRLGMGVGFGTGIDFNKRMKGRAGRAKAFVAADNQLEEMKQARRELRRCRKRWGKSFLEMEEARCQGEHDSANLLYEISRQGRLRARQEEQLRKLAELTAVYDPDLLQAAIDAVKEGDAESCLAAVAEGVGEAERGRMAKALARQREVERAEELKETAEKWRQHIMAAEAGISYEELMYAAEKKEQRGTELLSSIKKQVGEAVRENKEASGTLEGAFRAIDVDGGGSIDYEEFGEFLSRLGATVAEEDLELLTQMLDGDGDGSIDYDEFVAWFRGGASNATYAQQVADLFREFAPHRLGEVGSLLARYEYNKDTLLQALRKQYRVAEAERAKRDADRIKGCSSNSPGSSRPSSSGSVHPGSADTPPRTLAPIEGAPSVALVPLTPAGTIVSEAEGQGLDLMIIEEGAWQQASLGVSLIAKTTSPNRFAVAAAAALVAQEAEEEIQSRYDLSVWQTNEGVCVSERGLQEIQDALDEGQAAARAAAARARAFAEATAAMIIDGIEDTVQGVLAYKEERRLWKSCAEST